MSKLKAADVKLPTKEPFWKGPEIDGVTQSLLDSFLACRERFRIKTIEGLTTPPKFEVRLEYGNMWHVCEEALAANKDWKPVLTAYAKNLLSQYRTEQQTVNHWYEVCKRQFPIYVDYWKRHPDVKNRVPIFQEKTFAVPYELPSGESVILRGKFDAVDWIKGSGIYLQENKTKSQIDHEGLNRQLKFDLQTGFYLVALRQYFDNDIKSLSKVAEPKLAGVRYNVICRPLSGGKYSIKQHQPSKSKPQGETLVEYYDRLEELIRNEEEVCKEENREHHFFQRWNVSYTEEDIDRFEEEFLLPCLQDLLNWYTKVKLDYLTGSSPWGSHHYRYPYGVYNPTSEGYFTEYDNYINNGDMTGLVKAQSLFGELECQ